MEWMGAVGLLANPASSISLKSEVPPLLYKSIEIIEETAGLIRTRFSIDY
jgi:hypothetical protein